MKNIFEEILTWATSTLSYWEQATLKKLLSGKQIEESDYQELLKYFFEDNYLAPQQTNRTPIIFDQIDFVKEYTKKKIFIREISNLENVNALIPNQHLTFGNNLTSIYGLNGAGKSGYVRVLGSAGFTRGDREVLPDINKEIDVNAIKRASIKMEVDSVEKNIDYQIGTPCPELSTFYIFDSTSVKVHMVGKNTFSFSPAGLSILSELAVTTDEVRQLVRKKIQEFEIPNDFENCFSEGSEIQKIVKTITAESTYEYFAKIATLSSEEETRIHELDVEIGKIGLGQHQIEIEEKRRKLASIKRLYDWVRNLEESVSHDSISVINLNIKNYIELIERAKILSIQSFKHPELTQTGSDDWNLFMKSAYQLAKAEGTDDRKYPETGQPCIFCQQPLSSDSVELIKKIWAYLDEHIQVSISQIRDDLDTTCSGQRAINNYFKSEDYLTSISILKNDNSQLYNSAQNEVTILMRKNAEIIANIVSNKSIIDEIDESSRISVEVNQLQLTLNSELQELEKMDLEAQIKRLENERKNLLERKNLQKILPQIKIQIEKLEWAKKAKSVLGSTRQITQKHNSLFDELVRDRYIEIFKDVLKYLDRPLQVEIVTSGQKGESIKQIQLKAHKSASEIANPEKVLSEGEKRAVAFADFITEAKLDTNCSGIILDDPVTSLDFEWRQKIADFLVEESKNRQVIIFTHDLPFLYFLISFSEERKVDNKAHWIMREGSENKPGYVSQDNCPPLEQKYKSPIIAETFLNQAKVAHGLEQQYLLSSGFGHLRTCYEVLVIYDLFGGVVRRFEDRVRMGALKSLIWDKDIVDDIYEGFERLSRYIDAHSHSDPMAVPANPEMLQKEISLFISLQTKIKQLKKAINKN